MRRVSLPIAIYASVALGAALTGCGGPAETGSFDKTLTVSGPIRLELSNASGAVKINAGPDAEVKIHADVRAHGFLFSNAKETLDNLVSNPPIEQRDDVVRVGKNLGSFKNASIDYTITVPRGTEVASTVASGSQTVAGLRGPVKLESASGSIRVEHIERNTQVSSLSGSIEVQDIGDDVRVQNASGNVRVSNVKGDSRVKTLSGSLELQNPGGRAEVGSASGSVVVRGASNDVKADCVSGTVDVQGNPAATSYWDLRTTSGSVLLTVPGSANFYLTAESASGDIQTDIPIVIEEQGKHSLRAHIGNGGGRVEVHTASGQIRVRGGN